MEGSMLMSKDNISQSTEFFIFILPSYAIENRRVSVALVNRS
jgi:hypothetical protein